MLDSNGNPTQDACDLESYMTLSATNEGAFYQYKSNGDNSPCELDATFLGTWSEVSSSTYSVSFVEVGAGQDGFTLSAVSEGDTLTINGADEFNYIFTRN